MREAGKSGRRPWPGRPVLSTEGGEPDPDLESPGRARLLLFEHVARVEPGASKVRAFFQRLKRGPLHSLPDLEEWALEEFAYHGAPPDPWHPIDALLADRFRRLSPIGRLRAAWLSSARLGMWRIEGGTPKTFRLREWDPWEGKTVGEEFAALPADGAVGPSAARSRGDLLASYVAPWDPERRLHCALGLGYLIAPEDSRDAAVYLRPGLLAAAARLPWARAEGVRAAQSAKWRERDWGAWLRERLSFPFEAYARMVRSPAEKVVVEGLVPDGGPGVQGMPLAFSLRGRRVDGDAAGISPADHDGGNWAAIAEYQAWRAEARRAAGPERNR